MRSTRIVEEGLVNCESYRHLVWWFNILTTWFIPFAFFLISFECTRCHLRVHCLESLCTFCIEDIEEKPGIQSWLRKNKELVERQHSMFVAAMKSTLLSVTDCAALLLLFQLSLVVV